MTVEWVTTYPRMIIGGLFVVLLLVFLWKVVQRRRELLTNAVFIRQLDELLTTLHKDYCRAGRVDIQSISFFIERYLENIEQIWRDHSMPLSELKWHFTFNPKEVYLWVNLGGEDRTWNWTPTACHFADYKAPPLTDRPKEDLDIIVDFPLTPERHYE